MTLIYKLDLKILKLYLHTKNKLSRSRISKVTVLQTDRQTDATKCITKPHSQVVKHPTLDLLITVLLVCVYC